MTPVSIIIPAWNLWHLTKQCLESIATSLTADGLHGMVEVIVVNNGSTDDTNDVLPPTLDGLFGEHGKEVRLTENMGFSKGCNAGAAAANHPLLFFLNNDTLVTRGFLPPLVHALETEKSVGAVGPLLLYPDETVQHCGIVFSPTLQYHHLYEFFPKTHPLVQKKRSLQAITGAALLITAQLFAECGMFYESYINGCEDIDLCMQLTRKGLHCTCIPQSNVYHLVSQTPGRLTHEAYNSAVAYKRFQHTITCDLHSIGREDAFTTIISPTLHCYLTLPADKERAITAIFQENFHEALCIKYLTNHPLWFGGYMLLALHYEKEKYIEDALLVLKKLIALSNSLEHMELIIDMARRAEEKAIVASLEESMQNIQKYEQENKNNHLQRIQHLYSCAKQKNDLALQELYQSWLKQHGSSDIVCDI